MFALRLFGGLSLQASDGTPIPGRATQRRRLAVLAILATAPSRTIARDKLITLLWPESDTARARHLLAVALHELRRALGEQAILSHGDDVVLNGEVVWCDTMEFEQARKAGDHGRAAAVYAGPFLDGFFVTGAPAFEQWCAAGRDRFARAGAEALETLAIGKSDTGDHRGATDAWQRLAALEPYDTRIALRLIQALEAAGNRAGALRHAEAHIAQLRDDLGMSANAEMAAVTARLGAAPAASAQPTVAISPPPEAPPCPDPPSRGDPPRPPLWTRLRLTVTTTLLLAFGVGGAWVAWSPRSAAARLPTRVAVLPFTVRGDTGVAYLGEGMMDLLSTSLDGADGIQVVNPDAVVGTLADGRGGSSHADGRRVAEALGANRYLLGSVYAVGRRLRVHVAVYDPGQDSRAGVEVVVEGDADQLFDLVDRLTMQILAGEASAPGKQLVRIAALTSHSWPAVKAYLSGERDFRAGRFVAALESFGRAALLDSTFALAHYRLSLATVWADVPDTLPFDADARALRYSGRLSWHDRLLIRAYGAWRSGAADSAEGMYRDLLALYPEDVEAWHQLGETLFHYNPLRGRPLAEAREPFEQVDRLDPDRWGTVWHLALIAASERREDEFQSRAARLLALAPERSRALEIRALAALPEGDSQLWREIATAGDLQVYTLIWRVAVHRHDLRSADSLARLLLVPDRLKYSRLLGHEALACLALARGRWREAAREIAAIDRIDSSGRLALELRLLAAILPFHQTGRADLESLRRAIQGWESPQPDHRPLGQYLLGMASVAWGDTSGALAAMQELDASSDQGEWPRGLADGIRARIALRGGRDGDALRLLEQSRVHQWFGLAVTSPFQSQAPDRYLRAELLQAAGRHEEALGWYASFGEHGLHDLAYLAPALFHRGELYEQLGNSREAIRQYTLFTEMWRDADPELQPLVQQARARMASLRSAPR